jgi:hypothetical protein
MAIARLVAPTGMERSANSLSLMHRDRGAARRRGRRLVLVCALTAALACAGAAAIAAAAPVCSAGGAPCKVLLGTRAVGRHTGSAPSGRARAFRFVAARSGTARRLRVYLTRADRARVVTVGLYTDVKGHPGRRLSSGTVRRPKGGRWASVSLTAAAVKIHHRYWVAVLGQGGRVAYRGAAGRCTGRSSSQRHLSSLPKRWSNGARSRLCAISAYVIQTTVHPVAGSPTAPVSPPVPPVTPPPPPTPAAGVSSYAPAPCTVILAPGANIQNTLHAAAPGTVVCLAAGTYPASSLSLSNIAPASNITLESPVQGAAVLGALNLGSDVSNLTVQGFNMTGGAGAIGTESNVVFAYNTISGTYGATTGFHLYAGSGGTQNNIQMIYNQMDHLAPSDLSPAGAGECAEVDGGSDLEQNIVFSHNVCGPGIANHYTQLGGVSGLVEDDNVFLGPADPEALSQQEHNNVLHIFGSSSDIDFSGNVMRDTDSRGQSVLIESGHFSNIKVNDNLDVEDPACQTNSNCYQYAFWVEPTQGLAFTNNTVIGSHWGVLLGDYESGDLSSGSNWTIARNILVGTTANANLSLENCASACAVDYNVTSDGSARQNGSTHYVINWSPKWGNTSTYPPLGLSFAAGFTSP